MTAQAPILLFGSYGELDLFIKIRQALGDARRPLFYLAIPPSAFPMTVEHLSRGFVCERIIHGVCS